jgi:hypothetical protein
VKQVSRLGTIGHELKIAGPALGQNVGPQSVFEIEKMRDVSKAIAFQGGCQRDFFRSKQTLCDFGASTSQPPDRMLDQRVFFGAAISARDDARRPHEAAGSWQA